MRKKHLFLLGFSFILFASYSYHGNKNKMNRDYVPNEETTVRVAEAIWLPIYGQGIYASRPFHAKLKDSNVWEVEGTLKSAKGGVPFIEIQKSDCKILKVYHGK